MPISGSGSSRGVDNLGIVFEGFKGDHQEDQFGVNCYNMRKRQVVVRREESSTTTSSSITIRTVRYGECQKNHAADVGGYAVDGCREFMASGEEETTGALTCAACGCHRNFHRTEVETEVGLMERLISGDRRKKDREETSCEDD